MKQWVFRFNESIDQDTYRLKALLGGKGANLLEMTSIGLPVPPGFILSTESCLNYYENKQQIQEDIQHQVVSSLKHIESELKLNFGDQKKPLLFSVRSGARVSMPGMMDTILNVGLNDETVEGLALRVTPRFAYDSYRRLIQMYASVVLHIDHSEFEFLLDVKKRVAGIQFDHELDLEQLKSLIIDYKKCINKHGKEFPQDVMKQLWTSIEAVFKSWMNERAQKYREINNIGSTWGTAINIQAMVFGNLNDNSATGVCFTRNPSTGENTFFGEYLINAQGEDVVAGIRTPLPVSSNDNNHASQMAMSKQMPDVYNKLITTCKLLEQHFKDMQDIEFTVEDGKLWMLQTRSGKRSATAAIKIAVDLVNEGLITKEEAILRIDPNILDQLLHPVLDPQANNERFARGLPSSPGAASGRVVFSSKEAELRGSTEKLLLVRNETSPEDIGGMYASQGILTVRGGMTSHAAVVARGMGKPCITGAGQIHIDVKNSTMKVGDNIIKEGDVITINGSTGDVYIGTVKTTIPKQSSEFQIFMDWVDQYRTLKVRTNADTPQDAKNALSFNADGIGLCRTEHMFFKPERLVFVRKMILSVNPRERQEELNKLLEFQKEDFIEIFRIMEGLPVTIRLLDPPLHEFLPIKQEEITEFSKLSGISVKEILERLESLVETNPMLGHRGCRLGITSPEIYQMQAKAIFEAWIITGGKVQLEIMIPLILGAQELKIIKEYVEAVAQQVSNEMGKKVDYLLGTMIELPRAALQAHEIANHAEFFSFGTNDLTQATMGISRDDSSKFLKSYIAAEIFASDPFASLDQTGVGELIEIAFKRGKSVRSDLKVGVCGEHGGDPQSIEFFQRVGLDYVSCSPFRVPIARLACAQAAIKCSAKKSIA
jgi:pyruvate, orthophosphate dikinase